MRRHLEAKDNEQNDPDHARWDLIDLIDEKDMEYEEEPDHFWSQVEVIEAKLKALSPEDLAAHIVATRRVGRKFQEDAGSIQWISMDFENCDQGILESFCGDYSIFMDYDEFEVEIPALTTYRYKGRGRARIQAEYLYQARRLHRAYDDGDFRRCYDFIFDSREGNRPEDWPFDEDQVIKWLHENPTTPKISVDTPSTGEE